MEKRSYRADESVCSPAKTRKQSRLSTRNAWPNITHVTDLIYGKKYGEGRISQCELEGVAFAEAVSCVLESESEGPFYITDLGRTI